MLFLVHPYLPILVHCQLLLTLISPSEEYDKVYAHKPWVIKWNGTVYHFYNAVGNEGRVIALATSRKLD